MAHFTVALCLALFVAAASAAAPVVDNCINCVTCTKFDSACKSKCSANCAQVPLPKHNKVDGHKCSQYGAAYAKKQALPYSCQNALWGCGTQQGQVQVPVESTGPMKGVGPQVAITKWPTAFFPKGWSSSWSVSSLQCFQLSLGSCMEVLTSTQYKFQTSKASNGQQCMPVTKTDFCTPEKFRKQWDAQKFNACRDFASWYSRVNPWTEDWVQTWGTPAYSDLALAAEDLAEAKDAPSNRRRLLSA